MKNSWAVLLVLSLSGCQAALSLAGLPTHEPRPAAQPAPAEPVASAEPAASTSEPADDSADSDLPSGADSNAPVEYDEPVVAAAPEPPRCTAPGRPETCDGTCTDLWEDPNHCGACWNHCHSGDSCDMGQCRKPDGSAD